jgi:uncharacterized UPF0160 family protein
MTFLDVFKSSSSSSFVELLASGNAMGGMLNLILDTVFKDRKRYCWPILQRMAARLSSPTLTLITWSICFTNALAFRPHLHQWVKLRAPSAGSRAMATTTSSMFKRSKLDETPSSKVIGTHSGTFQADEAMGCWMLRQLPAYRNSVIVRSRDLTVLEPLDIVIDVAGVYDHSKLRYDHHQRGYDERFEYPKAGSVATIAEEPRCTKLSASGLVYRHYGKEVIQQFYPDLSSEYLDLAYVKLYDSLLEALDAIDTGVEMVPSEVVPLYKDSTGLANRVGRLNPRWNELDDSTGEAPSADERFKKAVDICGADFVACLAAIVESDIPAREFVERALLQRSKTCASGQILALDSGGLPWKGHLYDLEKIHKVDPLIKFVLYQDVSGMWRVQAVTVEGSAFTNRLSLPEAWRGVRDSDLESVTQISGSRFVHAAGFIGGADTYEGVLQMAQKALVGQP